MAKRKTKPESAPAEAVENPKVRVLYSRFEEHRSCWSYMPTRENGVDPPSLVPRDAIYVRKALFFPEDAPRFLYFTLEVPLDKNASDETTDQRGVLTAH